VDDEPLTRRDICGSLASYLGQTAEIPSHLADQTHGIDCGVHEPVAAHIQSKDTRRDKLETEVCEHTGRGARGTA
jgi:hypothetical protein